MNLSRTDREALEGWIEFRRRGEDAALLTLVAIDGSAPRPVGSHVAVSARGETVGFITGGCAEAALAAEARAAIKEGASRLRRYGAGSPYMDVKLPCGSGIDVLFSVGLEPAVVERACALLAERRPVALMFDLATGAARLSADGPGAARADGAVFIRRYLPQLRIEIVGKGPCVPALARLAKASGFGVSAASPEEETLALASPSVDRLYALSSPSAYDPADTDEWTAAAVMFHEHDWDPPVVARLIRTRCFYIGALGSRRTHQERVRKLIDIGVSEKAAGEICGPIGLDISAKSPEEIAVSTLAEIIRAANADRGGGRWRR